MAHDAIFSWTLTHTPISHYGSLSPYLNVSVLRSSSSSDRQNLSSLLSGHFRLYGCCGCGCDCDWRTGRKIRLSSLGLFSRDRLRMYVDYIGVLRNILVVCLQAFNRISRYHRDLTYILAIFSPVMPAYFIRKVAVLVV